MGVGKAARRLAALLALPVAAAAVSPSVEMRRLQHDSWTETSGAALGRVQRVEQGPDGYLWLGTLRGLLRFDGMRFSVPPLRKGLELPPGTVSSMSPARDGTVWVGYKAGLGRIRDGAFELDTRLPLPIALAQGPAGETWALQPESVWRREPRGGSWRRFTTADGLPAGLLHSIAPGADGSVWLGLHERVCRWREGSAAACRPFSGTVGAISVTASGDAYAASERSVARVSAAGVEPLADLPSTTYSVLVDREGNVWIGTSVGLLRIRQGVLERFTRRDGLSSDSILAICEDAEGDIWLGTSSGIDRLRDPRVLHLSSLDGLSSDQVDAVAAAPNGEIWLGTGNGVTRIQRGRMLVYTEAEGVPGRTVWSVHIDRDGGIWIAANLGIARFDGRRFVEVPGSRRANGVFSMSDGPDGVVWGALQRYGVWRIERARATPAMPGPFPDTFRVADIDGALWIGSFAHGVAVAKGTAIERFDAARGVGPGPARAIYGDGSAVWIGAGRTLSRIRGGKVTAWGPRQGLEAQDIQAVAEDAHGFLWILAGDSVLRVARAELDRAPDGSPGPLRVKRYDARDGLRVTASGMTSPRLAVASDGRIWVCEQDGVGILDPDLLRPDNVPPPVHVEQITVDGTPLDYGARSFRGRETRISYTGIGLRAPHRVRFRYRLEPGQPQWTDANAERVVTFVNLSPDTYRFRVTACNLDDVCNEAGDVVEFRIVPYFRQTIWFKLLLAMAVGLLAWSAHRLRLRQMQARFRLAAQERARVTREIHDTLLQGFAGVVYQLDAAERMFESRPEASKERLHKALDQADNALTEARKTLQDMRLPVLEDRTLPEALREAGDEAVAGTKSAFTLRVHGAVAELPYTAQAAMYLIGREAIRNAANHANAGRITAVLDYRGRKFEMLIQDDGSGFDAAAATKKEGHFGVASMGERAKQIGAEFRIDTAPGKGTTVRVSMARK